ncbi:MerR family transcriptional regulator [Candidatus Binatia bacterium]|nr:MerR family transcriptional regulator [Candidatus Binatia bacterium]
MDYRIEALAAAAGVSVDTVRFYQARGLLPRPRRVGRTAVYGRGHLDRLQRIRKLQGQGFNLAAIRQMLAAAPRSKRASLLAAVAEQRGAPAFTRAQLAAESGVPEPLLASLEAAGLLGGSAPGADARRYTAADAQLLRTGLSLLEHGLPLPDLLALAAQHDRNTRSVVDAAVDLFDRFVRRIDGDPAASGQVAETFRQMLPAVTGLVALHFQRTLLARAMQRLRERGDQEAYSVAEKVLRSGRLDLDISWR